MFKKIMPPIFWSDRDFLERGLAKLPEVTYQRLREFGFKPKTIIDIGASHGHWSASVATIFPDARFFMFDALEENRPHLEKLNAPQFIHEICVLAEKPGHERNFSISGTGSSLYSERSNAPRQLAVVRTKSLDDVLASHQLEDPLFLKLDVQGAELEILKGGTHTLEHCEVVQMEVAFLKYNEGAPDFADVVLFMNERGFKMYDIAGFVRPTGTHLVQIDALFVRENSSLRPDFFEFKKS